MSTAEPLGDDSQRRMTREEYLAWEEKQERPHDYSGGRVYAQAGASRDHGRIISNLVARLDEQLRDRPCDVFANALRLWVEEHESYYNPDVMVACGDIQLVEGIFDTLANPVLVIEVSSKSTIGVDQIRKRRHYRSIPSVIEYLLVEQYDVGIERVRRAEDDHWDSLMYHSLDQVIDLTSIGGQLRVADIYRRVDFGDSDPKPPSAQTET